MKLGALIRVKDGDKWRTATVVYHGLDGYGAKWGEHELTDDDCKLIESGGPFGPKPPDEYEWFPDVMLRDGVEWYAEPKVLARFESQEQAALGEITGAMDDLQTLLDEREDKDA